MENIDRISSGINGIDKLLYGGFIKNSVNSIVGSSGTGKTTFALAYLQQGLIAGDDVLYLSFEEEPKKLISEGKSLGINLEEHHQNISEVIHLVESEKIVEFMTEILPALAKKLKTQQVKHTRIVLDPLTPILWEFTTEKEQRRVLTKVYNYLSSLGTVLQTVEEPNAFGQTDIGASETRVPIYLSDTVIHIQNLGLGGKYNRTCKVVKSRKTAHLEGIYPLRFNYGTGIEIETGTEHETSFNVYLEERKQEVLEKLRLWSKSSDKKQRTIAEIGIDLIKKPNKKNQETTYEIIKLLADSGMVQEVKR
ncbi:MAG: ATPase [Candidatus Heimdallarchaeum endolithica]|uniref:ATPase n=1 Tax=Candidatus Heimdallarchaeum endolithica TaxID=2876572 RepID=A0A9Y1FMG8_9ARCH|nr:MAG: ATPase [Candidatus Heimdallarchaeum endolithica]